MKSFDLVLDGHTMSFDIILPDKRFDIVLSGIRHVADVTVETLTFHDYASAYVGFSIGAEATGVVFRAITLNEIDDRTLAQMDDLTLLEIDQGVARGE